MRLLEGERVIVTSDGDKLVLSTHRVRYESRRAGRAELVSIMLEEISSCAVVYRSNVAFVVAAFLAALVAASGRFPDYQIALWVVTVLALVGYYFSRRQVLSLTSAGDSIRVPTVGMKFDAVKEFIDSVEAAKSERYAMAGSSVVGRVHSV